MDLSLPVSAGMARRRRRILVSVSLLSLSSLAGPVTGCRPGIGAPGTVELSAGGDVAPVNIILSVLEC